MVRGRTLMDKVVSFHALDPSRWASACVFFCKPNIQSGLNAYQIQQMLYPAVSSEQSSVLDKAVYYSQFLNANLEFSGLSQVAKQSAESAQWSLRGHAIKADIWNLWVYFPECFQIEHTCLSYTECLRDGLYSDLRQTIAMTTTAIMKTKLAVMDPTMSGNCSCHDFGGSALRVKERKWLKEQSFVTNQRICNQ